MKKLEHHYKTVEAAITRLGIEPEKCRGENAGQWMIVRGSVTVYLDLWYIEKRGRAYFQVMAPVIKIPTKRREQFYEELLRLNNRFFGVAFSVDDTNAWIKVIREVDGMDDSEALAMISRVGNYADKYDDELKLRYFGK